MKRVFSFASKSPTRKSKPVSNAKDKDEECLAAACVETSKKSVSKDQSEDCEHDDIIEKRVRVKDGSKMVYMVLAIAAVVFGAATYFLLSSSKEQEFRSEFRSYARETADLAENNAENTFGQLRTLATAITSIAASTGKSFPNVTIPHFDMRAQEITDLTGAEMILFAPFVERHQRNGYEAFVQENHQTWMEQDYVIRGWNPSDIEPINGTIHPCEYCQYINDTRQGFDDQDEVMEQIMSSLQYEIDGFTLPVSQYGPSPVWNDTSLVLMDLWTHAVFKKEVVASLEYDVPVISETLDLDFLLQFITTQRESHSRDRNILRSFTLDQVKDNFGEDAQTIGYVIGIVPWSTFFQNLLPENVNGIVVIVESDCGSEFTYIVNGGQDDWCAIGDHHDPKYESMKQEYKFFWKEHPKGTSRHCHFDLAIYPSNDFHKQYESNEPVLYAGLVGLAFLFVAVVFALYDVFIYQRQKRVLMDAQNLVIENATNSARKERELNDFIAHEVRNPLAAAISACSFVSSAISEESLLVPGGMGANPLIGNNAKRKSVEEDINIIESSLHFINDLLRNMLDMQRASTNQLNIEMQPTHLLNDVLKPVDSMLHRRGTSFQVYVECCSEEGETDIVILADKLRLKQIMLNLARNSVKFVEKGFILLAAKVVVNSTTCKKTVLLSVEDSGPGIPEEKRKQLFQKFQDSLDSLHQGTGIGLSLCKLLTDLMGGEIYIDDTYDSGISGQPGTRFVVDLNISPIKWDDDALDKYSSDIAPIENNRNDITKHNIYNSSCSFGNGYGNNITSSLKDVDGRLSNETLHKRHLESPSANKDNDGAEGAAKKPQKKPLPSELVVLFVDDDMVLRKLFCRAVKKIAPDWTLMEASSGETALTMASEYDFDIIFMDQYMASVQKQLLGTEATRALRAQGETANICGLSANDVEEAFFEAGADSFMMKPFPCKPELLKEELLRVLNNQRTI